MATTYDKASLVMIPSGVKESKLYSVKPTDGSGDFTFSRGTDTATRVNASGLIEKEISNQVLQSNTFSSGTWLKQVSGGTTPTLTSGQPDPFGGNNAWRLECSITGGLYSMMSQGLSTTGLNCNSIYIKSNTGSDQDVYFRISNSDQTTTRTATNTWQRIEVFTGAVGQSFTIGVRSAATGATSSCDVLIYGAQNNEGLVAQSYIETTTAAVYEGITDNLPRLDYSGGASCPSLLLEPQRTNLITQSEYLDGAPFKSRVIITDNAIVSPEGLQNAGKIVATSVSGSHALDYIPSVVASDYSMSIYAKAGELSKFVLLTNNRGTNMARGFDVSDGTTFANDLGYNEPTSYSIEEVGNDWYLCTMQFPKTSAGGAGMGVYLTNASGQYSFTGNDVDGMYFWGWQLEAGSYPTSYIPTYGTSATRADDEVTKTSVDSLFGTNTGTIFVDFDTIEFNYSAGNYVFDLSAGADTTNRIGVYFDAFASDLRFFYYTSAGVGTQQSFDVTIADIKKIALKWTNSSIQMFYNGTATSSYSFGVTAPNKLTLFARYTNNENLAAKNNQVLLFPTALTDAECIALTTI